MDAREQARTNLILAVKAIGMYFEIKTIDQLRARLWGACQRLFKGGRDANFIGTFARSIDVQLTEAWNKGADEMGFAPSDMTDEDRQVLTDIIDNENNFIDGMVEDVIAARESGLEFDKFSTQFQSRVDMWANRYTDVVNQARVYFGGKNLLEWVEGDTLEKCSDCVRLNGIVATAQEWADYKLKPQSQDLECHGFNCQCQLVPTDKKRTKGGIPKR